MKRAETAVRRSHPTVIPPRASTAMHIRSKSIKQNVSFLPQAPDSFGSNSPKWTIPSGRKPLFQIPLDVPGPGSYDQTVKSTRYMHAFEGSGRTDSKSETDNCDLSQPRIFPEIKQKTIAPLDGFKFFYPISDTPGPCYFEQTHTRPQTIGSCIQTRSPTEEFPSPADYSPDYETKSQFAYSLPKAQRNTYFDDCAKQNPSPGPGTYNIQPESKRPPKWAGRLRSRSKAIRQKELSRTHVWDDEQVYAGRPKPTSHQRVWNVSQN